MENFHAINNTFSCICETITWWSAIDERIWMKWNLSVHAFRPIVSLLLRQTVTEEFRPLKIIFHYIGKFLLLFFRIVTFPFCCSRYSSTNDTECSAIGEQFASRYSPGETFPIICREPSSFLTFSRCQNDSVMKHIIRIKLFNLFSFFFTPNYLQRKNLLKTINFKTKLSKIFEI